MKIAELIVRIDTYWEDHASICNAIFGCVMGLVILAMMAYVVVTGD